VTVKGKREIKIEKEVRKGLSPMHDKAIHQREVEARKR